MLCLNNTNHKYNIHNSKLVNATEVVDLGVTVDSNMRFDKHINKIVTKAHQRAALIARCFKSNKMLSYRRETALQGAL